jgi:hypothetical protein
MELEATHAEWLRNAKKGCRELDAAGATYTRVVVGVDELVAWCREQNRPLDASARAHCAAERLRLRAQGRKHTVGR